MTERLPDKISLSRTARWLVLVAAGAFIVLSVATSLTKRPWSDEGWFANAPLNLVTKGFMGTTVIEQAGRPFLNGIDRFTYWVMPLHLLLQAAFYKIFGFSLLTMRSLSLLFGLLALGSEDIQKEWLPGVASGEAVVAFGLVAAGVDVGHPPAHPEHLWTDLAKAQRSLPRRRNRPICRGKVVSDEVFKKLRFVVPTSAADRCAAS